MFLIPAFVASEVIVDLALLVGAAALVLILWGGRTLFVEPLRAVLSAIPVIGSQLGDAVGSGIGSAIGWASSWAESGLWPLVSTVLALPQRAVQFAGALVGAIEGVIDFAAGLETRLTVLAANTAGGLANLGKQLSGLPERVAQLVVAAAAAVSSIELITHTLIPKAQKDAITAAAAHTTGAVNVEQAARLAADNAVRAADAASVAAEATARARAVAEALTAAHAYTSAEAATRAAADAGIRAATAAADKALSSSIADVDAKVQPIVDAHVVAELASLAAVVETTFARCVIPQCNWFGSQSGTFGALTSGAELLAILALVEAAMNDPEGTARSTAAAAGTLHDGAAGILGLVGIHV